MVCRSSLRAGLVLTLGFLASVLIIAMSPTIASAKTPSHAKQGYSKQGAQLSPMHPIGGIPSCRSITFRDYNGAGEGIPTIGVQVNPRNGYLQWGAYIGRYSGYNAGEWILSVYVNGRKVDGKRQNYHPHGSLPPRVARSGSFFEIKFFHRSEIFGYVWYQPDNGCRVP